MGEETGATAFAPDAAKRERLAKTEIKEEEGEKPTKRLRGKQPLVKEEPGTSSAVTVKIEQAEETPRPSSFSELWAAEDAPEDTETATAEIETADWKLAAESH